MRLSELKTGESGTIVKVMGHGGFRRRIMEMGFVRGQRVEVLLNAPLKDPIEYKIMGYDISLRRSEADMVEVLTDSEATEYLEGGHRRHHHEHHHHHGPGGEPERNDAFGAAESGAECCTSIDEVVTRRTRTITVALVGNPNSGKTTLFNALTGSNQFVGNWPGVTVEKKEGKLKKHDGFEVMDLPGIYSLSPYSPEEVITRNYLLEENPDVIVNIVDGSNLERNLYLTMQLLEMGCKVVVALNMMDLVRANGDVLDTDLLSKELGCPVVPITATSGEGVERTFQLYSPLIASIEVKRHGDVRRAKLYYLRNLSGKAARIKEKLVRKA